MKQLHHLLVIAFMLAVALSTPAHAQNAKETEETLLLADQYIVLKKQNEKLKQEVLDREQELTALQNKEKELKAKLKYFTKGGKKLITTIKNEQNKVIKQKEEIANKTALLKQKITIELSQQIPSNDNLFSLATDSADIVHYIAEALIVYKYDPKQTSNFFNFLEESHSQTQSPAMEKLRHYSEYNTALISLFDNTIKNICITSQWDMEKAMPLIQDALASNEYCANCYNKADKAIPYLDLTIDDFKEIMQYGAMTEKIINIFVSRLK